MNVRPFLATAVLGLLAACASMPPPQMQRADRLPGAQAGTPADGVRTGNLPESMGSAGPRPVIRRGSAAPINQSAASAPPPSLASSGQASFNFEGESLHAVVKAILGDMLGQSYSIAPGVSGTVTIATQKPVGSAGALNLLEGVLAQNNARMVYTDGRYNIVPADQALTSGVVPRTGSPAMARGFESRVVPLRYVAAAEMEKILKPYAKQGSIVSVDGARNIITVAGTRAELENYVRTIQVFDVDWMASMSVGVFPLAVRPRQPRGAGPGARVRRAEQDPGRRHVPLHAAGHRQRGDGDHQPAELPGRHPAVDRPHRRRQRRWPPVLLRAQVHPRARPGRPPVRGVR